MRLAELVGSSGSSANDREEIGFAKDSPLEGDGFELPVPGWTYSAAMRQRLSARNRAESLRGRTRTWAGLAMPAAAVEAPTHAVTETATKTRMHKAGHRPRNAQAGR
jgi:hypothetical protein